jgi:hypothetical protein
MIAGLAPLTVMVGRFVGEVEEAEFCVTDPGREEVVAELSTQWGDAERYQW